nr:NUDIX domain-containing protein [uncultured Anaerocolumna sp.]
MAIRNAAKAIIIENGKILLNKCIGKCNEIYYDLPGGGQNQFEEMEDAVKRECLEESGYRIEIIRFAALAEEIYDDSELRKQYYDYTHRIHHIFIAKLADKSVYKPTETDMHQLECVWVDINDISSLDLRPKPLKTKLIDIIHSEKPLYLGTVHVL